MSKVILGLTMSLDGYICDADGSLTPLFSDVFEAVGGISDEGSRILEEAVRTTGAVIMGKNAFMMAGDIDSYADDYEFQVPLFILTHHVPDKHPRENENLTITFVTEGIEKAVELAKSAVAKDKDVVIIGGAQTAQQAIRSKVIDEIDVDIMPVILGGGLKLFAGETMDSVRLEKIQVKEYKERVSMKYRVLE
jgi:dihydrofolate reductase